MRILITGATGFPGSQAAGHEMVGMNNSSTGRPDSIAHPIGRPDFRFVEHDFTDSVHAKGPLDGVLHPWAPTVALEQGLERTIPHFREHLARSDSSARTLDGDRPTPAVVRP